MANVKVWLNAQVLIRAGSEVKTEHAIICQLGKISQIVSMAEYPFIKSQLGSDLEEFDLNGKLVTPGLIDSHSHAVYAGNRADEFVQRLNGASYQEIAAQGGGILSTVKATRAASEQELYDAAVPRIKAMMSDGVTRVEIKSGYGLNLDSELKMLKVARRLGETLPIKVSTCLLGAHALPPEFAGRSDDYISWVCDQLIPAAVEHKLADAVDVFCEGIGFSTEQSERVYRAGQHFGLPIRAHVEQLSNIGGAALAARYQALSVDHIEYLDEAGVKAMAESGTVATLLPGAFYFLKETQKPPISLLREYGVPMAIATDLNPGTAPLASLRLMMNMSCVLFGLTLDEALAGVTLNSAKALGVEGTEGQIEPGFSADLAIWHCESPGDLIYQMHSQLLYARVVSGEMNYV